MRPPRPLATLLAPSTLRHLSSPCRACQHDSLLSHIRQPTRLLSHSAARPKAKTIRAGNAEVAIKTARSNRDTAPPDVLKTGIFNDFQPSAACDPAQVDALWTTVDEHFRDTIKTVLRHATFDHAWIGDLRVRADSAADAEKQRRKAGVSVQEELPIFKLREVAEVVPREGRHVAVLVHEAAWMQPVRHALTRRMGRAPQSPPASPLELGVQLERKRPQEVAASLKETVQSWRDQVRRRRTKYEQMVKEWARKNELLVDEMRRAQRMLQERQDAKMKMIAEEHQRAMKAVHRSAGMS